MFPYPIFLYDNLNKMPIMERIQIVLNGKTEKQWEYLVHMLEELVKWLDKLM